MTGRSNRFASLYFKEKWNVDEILNNTELPTDKNKSVTKTNLEEYENISF